MICVLCEKEVENENVLGLCQDCDKNFIAGLHNGEDEGIARMIRKFDKTDDGKRYTLDEVLGAEEI